MKLTLNHLQTDLGLSISGNTFDEYEVKLDDKPIVHIRYEYDENKETVIVTGETLLIPNCTCVAHLLASVNMQFLKGFTEDHTFFYEQFYDDEAETSVEIDLTILPL